MPQKERYSYNYLISRFIIIFNIIVIITMVSVMTVFFTALSDSNLPLSLKSQIPKISSAILILGVGLILANIILLLINIVYGSKQYFKVLEKINFEDINGAINLVNNVDTIDEIGHLGKQVSKLLKIYISFAAMYKKRLHFEKLKLKVYLEQMPSATLVLSRSTEVNKPFLVNFINKKCLNLLNVESSSFLIGKSFSSLLEKESRKKFIDILTKKISLTPLETNNLKIEPIAEKLEFLNLSQENKTLEQENMDSQALSCDAIFIPFIFQFFDNYESPHTEETSDYQNKTIDSIFISLYKSTKPDNHEMIEDSNEPIVKTDSKKDL